MLEELRIYKNLGTPEYFFELANLLANHANDVWTVKKIQKYFFNRVINGRSIFDGCIQLAIQINFIEVAKDDSLVIPINLRCYLNQKESFSEKFVEYLLATISKDKMCYEIFSPEHLSYDLVNKSIKITNNAFGFKYSQLKQLLLDFNILIPISTEISSYYIIAHDYMNLFQKDLMAEVKRRTISPEHLKLILEMQNQYGQDAERFVLKYEITRLEDMKELIWVADYSVSEGYDIASFNSINSLLHDRFIEVKSYSGKATFYWSKNEVETSRIKGKNYYLYLVNRDEANTFGYSPTIIQNPFEDILSNPSWEKEVEKYFIYKTQDFD